MFVTKFLAADLHLGHKGVTQFKAPNGIDKLRPWETTEEMDEALIANWNSRVKPTDESYILGDVVLNRKNLHTIARLNGRKHLVKGNHDIFRLEEYQQYFYEVSACRCLKDMILTHIPIHPSNIGRFGVNVHGHLHASKVRLANGEPDPRYLCVSLEQTNFMPLTIEEVREQVNRRKDTFPEFFNGEWE